MIGIFLITAGCGRGEAPQDEQAAGEMIVLATNEYRYPSAQLKTMGSATDSAHPLNEAVAPAPGPTIPAVDLSPQAILPDPAPIPENPTSRQIQQALANAGLYRAKIDGILGPKSKTAIRQFQRDHDLAADGTVGPKTWTQLGPYLHHSSAEESSGNETDQP